MSKAWIERQTTSSDARRQYEVERLILWTTETIAEAMERRGLSKAHLADTLGVSRSHITQLLSGSRNMTLRSLADLAYACGMRAEVTLEALTDHKFRAFPLKLIGVPRARHVAATEGDRGQHTAPAIAADENPLAA